MESDDGAARSRASFRLTPAWRVGLLTAVMAASAVALTISFIGLGPVEPDQLQLSLLLLAVLFAATEVMVIHLSSGRGAYSLSFGEAPLVMGLALASPVDLVVGRVIGSGASLWLHRHQPARKLAFNVSMIGLETALVVLVYRWALGDAEIISPRGVLAGLVATLSADTFGTVAVTLVIWASGVRPRAASVWQALSVALVTGLANAGIGLGLVASVTRNPWFLVPLGLSAVVLFLLYQAYHRLAQRYTSLATLHEFTRSVGGSLDLGVVASTLLSATRRMLRVRRAHLLVLGEDGAEAVWVTDRDGELDLVTVPDVEARRRLADLLPDGNPQLLSAGSLPAWLAAEGLKEVVVSPVRDEHDLVGVAVALDRASDVAFDSEDVTLFETLTNLASVSLENSHLFARLQDEAAQRTYQALHDPLTGLPNRQALDERVASALATAARNGTKVGVVLIDLDGFKEVNDTLGHQVGDSVLRELCSHMDGVVPADALIARFGGDEFVLLLPSVADADDAVAQATPLLDFMNAPITFGGLTLAVGARMGVALYPDHALDATTLVQRADVAMYDARASLTRSEVYTPERDPFTPQRLALVGHLREAIGRAEIEVWYQPQQDLRTGLVVGAEALVRWRHPERGIIEPNDFVPFSDRSDLSRPLALHVLATAIAQCVRWRERGFDLSVAVNLSVRNLLDPDLPGDVLDLLVASRLPAEELVLEVTESSIMSDSRRSVGAITQLRQMGVQLSIDDFGTGHSSLSRLRHLPVSELKIDRQFVALATSDSHDAAIVTSTVELAHRLGLRVVAEGAENADTVAWLTEISCDAVQGYFLSRPLPPDVFDAWLSDHMIAKLPA